MNKRCYILGAGFSKPFGLPLASELTKEVIGHISSNAIGVLKSHIGGRLGDMNSFLRKLYPYCDFKSAWPDLEDLFTVLDEWEVYRKDVEGTQTPKDKHQPANIKKDLLRHLALLISEKTPAKDNCEFQSIQRFVKNCEKNYWPIISFNWDVLLEAAAKDAEIDYGYGGKDMCENLQLAKPHGSINIADLDKHKYDEQVMPRKIIYEYDNHVVIRANDPREAKKEIVNPFGVRNNASHNGDSQTDQTSGPHAAKNSGGALVIAPTAKKSYKHPWLITQWRRAYDFILEAKEIVVIGFSLPPTDYRPRVLLQLAGINRDVKPKLILVDPRACEVAERYREFVSLPIECRNGSWVECLEEGLL